MDDLDNKSPDRGWQMENPTGEETANGHWVYGSFMNINGMSPVFGSADVTPAILQESSVDAEIYPICIEKGTFGRSIGIHVPTGTGKKQELYEKDIISIRNTSWPSGVAVEATVCYGEHIHSLTGEYDIGFYLDYDEGCRKLLHERCPSGCEDIWSGICRIYGNLSGQNNENDQEISRSGGEWEVAIVGNQCGKPI